MVISYKNNGSKITFSGHNNYEKKRIVRWIKSKILSQIYFEFQVKRFKNGYSRRKHQNEEEINKI